MLDTPSITFASAIDIYIEHTYLRIYKRDALQSVVRMYQSACVYAFMRACNKRE